VSGQVVQPLRVEHHGDALRPLMWQWLGCPALVLVLPELPGLRFQALPAADAGQADRLAIVGEVADVQPRGRTGARRRPAGRAAWCQDGPGHRHPGAGPRWSRRATARCCGCRSSTSADAHRAGWSAAPGLLGAIRAFLEGLRAGAGVWIPTRARAGGPLWPRVSPIGQRAGLGPRKVNRGVLRAAGQAGR
jgi:hypothetical protein